MLDCVQDIAESAAEITSSTLEACWKQLLPEMNINESPPPSITDEIQRIIAVAHTVGGEGSTDLTADEVENEMNRKDPEALNEEYT